MKKVRGTYVIDQIINGDDFGVWMENFDEACKKANEDFEHLTDYDKNRRELVMVTEYEDVVEDDEGIEDIEMIDSNIVRQFTIYEKDIRFVIRDREAGNEIDEFMTLAEAEKELESYENTDREEGTYTPDFYEIVEAKK